MYMYLALAAAVAVAVAVVVELLGSYDEPPSRVSSLEPPTHIESSTLPLSRHISSRLWACWSFGAPSFQKMASSSQQHCCRNRRLLPAFHEHRETPKALFYPMVSATEW